MNTIKKYLILSSLLVVGAATWAQGMPGNGMLPGPNGMNPNMNPPSYGGAGFLPQGMGEQPPMASGCGMARNDFTRIINSAGTPTPMYNTPHQ